MSTFENEALPGTSEKTEEEGDEELVKPSPMDAPGTKPASEMSQELEAQCSTDDAKDKGRFEEEHSGTRGTSDAIVGIAGLGEGSSSTGEELPRTVGLGDNNTRKLQDLHISSDKATEPMKKRNREKSLPPPPLPLKDDAYLDSTPKTPVASRSPIRMQSGFDSYNEKTELGEGEGLTDAPPDYEENEKQPEKQEQEPESTNNEDSESEIQSIIGQFQDDQSATDKENVVSPRLGMAGHLLGGQVQYPPRRSSLEPLRSPILEKGDQPAPSWLSAPGHSSSPRMQRKFSSQSLTLHSPHFPGANAAAVGDEPGTPSSAPQPPPPEPEPDQPFDFHRFLEQLRHRTADPVAKFLRSFLTEFGKKQWMVHEQVKIISDFLAFITNKMAQCEVWRGVSDAEFDNAKEGMEKLVMNRLYTQTFSPAIPPPPPPPRSKGKRRDVDRVMTPGRRGQHQEDVERDEILGQKVRIYGWVREEHLDIPDVGPNGRRFLTLAQQGDNHPCNVRWLN
jgi:hypothetical protein